MKITFWLLDVNYEVKNHMPEIWLWGVDDSGNRVLVVDRNFLAYFYVVIEENASQPRLLKKLKRRSNLTLRSLKLLNASFLENQLKP